MTVRYIAIIICGLILTACPSFLKALQILELKDSSGTVVGKIGGTAIHYAKDADAEFSEDHYAIVISNASVDDSISDAEFAKIDSIGIKDKDSGKIITDNKYKCDKSTDIKANGFGCRFLASNVGTSKTVTLTFLLTDKTTWNTNDIDLTKFVDSTEIGKDVEEVIKGIGSGAVKMESYTLKTCPPDASGKTVDIKSSETCPTGEAGNTTEPGKDESCPSPNIKDKDGKCISVLQPKAQCDGNTVMLLNGSCGADCGDNQVQKMGKCQCQIGYMKDATGSNCVIDPSTNVNPPPASSSGGGSCSLIKTSVPPTPIATPKTYDLKDTGLVPGASVLPGVVNQLKDVTLVRGTSSDGHDTYTLKATFKASYNGKNYGQASELSAVDTSTGTAVKLVPRNTTATGEHLCMPVVSGDTAKFSCIYRVSENATLPTGTLYLSLTIPKVMTLTTATTVDAKDFEAKEAPPPPPPPPAPACKDPTPILLPSGACGVDPNTNVLPASGGPTGNNCSLNPLATSGAEIKTILALLLCTMLAARACHSSRN